MGVELSDVSTGFRKGQSSRDIADACWIIKKAREYQKEIQCKIYWLYKGFKLRWLC